MTLIYMKMTLILMNIYGFCFSGMGEDPGLVEKAHILEVFLYKWTANQQLV